jgi:hypothetical protein
MQLRVIDEHVRPPPPVEDQIPMRDRPRHLVGQPRLTRNVARLVSQDKHRNDEAIVPMNCNMAVSPSKPSIE